MSLSFDLPLILAAAFVSSASPGPATLAIADTAMQAGRRSGLALAAGVVTGSLAWSIAAALGLAAVMASSAWMLEVMRYCGGTYLLYLACKSARSALRGTADPERVAVEVSPSRAYATGLALHLTNPKAILFFGSLYTLGLSPRTSPAELILVIAAVGLQSAAIFTGCALLFSHGRIAPAYRRLRRWFDGAFALLFAGAGLRMLTTRLPT